MGVKDHKCHSVEKVKCAVLTISDSRTKENDDSGRIIIEELEKNGHEVLHYSIVKDDMPEIQDKIQELLRNSEVQAMIVNGGTGISKRDVTVESIVPIVEKKLEGFGELFRALSYDEIGSASIMSRAFAGVANGKVILCVPGSPNACNLAMEKLIIPELGHMVWEANR